MFAIQVFRLGYRPPTNLVECPKCSAISGDDWAQCGGICPMKGSPHYNADLAAFLPDPQPYVPPVLVGRKTEIPY